MLAVLPVRLAAGLRVVLGFAAAFEVGVALAVTFASAAVARSVSHVSIVDRFQTGMRV